MKKLLFLFGLALVLRAGAQVQNPPLHHGFVTTNEVHFIGGTNINVTTRNSGPSNTIIFDYTGTGTAGPQGPPGTNTTVVLTNYFSQAGQMVLSNQTSLVFDFSQAQTWWVWSTYTATNTVSFTLTNLLVPQLNVVLYNLAASNLSYSWPSNINWVWQANTNAPVPTNCYPGVVQRIGLDVGPAGASNNVVGHVNP